MSNMPSSRLFALSLLVALVQAQGGRKETPKQHENHILLLVHASTAVLAWVVFFPLGAVLLRLIETKNSIWYHAAIQVLATALYTIAIGTGIYLADQYHELDVYHPVFGLVIFALVFIQIIGGILHHLFFKKYLRRTVVSHIHIWLGRILITAGIINGGLGLLMARGNPKTAASTGEIVAYGVIAGIIWAVTMAIGFWKAPKQGRSPEGSAKDRMYAESELSPPRHKEMM